MSQPLEYGSKGSSSQTDMDYHSKLESKSEERQIIPIDDTVGFMFLDIQFPLPLQFSKPYIRLQEIISHEDDALSKPYEWTHPKVP